MPHKQISKSPIMPSPKSTTPTTTRAPKPSSRKSMKPTLSYPTKLLRRTMTTCAPIRAATLTSRNSSSRGGSMTSGGFMTSSSSGKPTIKATGGTEQIHTKNTSEISASTTGGGGNTCTGSMRKIEKIMKSLQSRKKGGSSRQSEVLLSSEF